MGIFKTTWYHINLVYKINICYWISRRVLGNTVMNLLIPWKAKNFLASWASQGLYHMSSLLKKQTLNANSFSVCRWHKESTRLDYWSMAWRLVVLRWYFMFFLSPNTNTGMLPKINHNPFSLYNLQSPYLSATDAAETASLQIYMCLVLVISLLYFCNLCFNFFQ